MKEIEAKAKIHNVSKLKESLMARGCVFCDSLKQDDIIFLPAGIEFPEITKEVPVVRVRNSNGKILLTLKKGVISGNELIKIEEEVMVNSLANMIAIIEHMDYHEVVRVSKTRTECKLDDLTICIDNVSNLGYFVEVEKLTNDENVESIQQSLFDFLLSLGIFENDIVTKGYDTMMYERR